MYLYFLICLVLWNLTYADKTNLDYVRQCKDKDYIGVISNVRIYRAEDGVTQLFDYDLNVKETSNIRNSKVMSKTEKCSPSDSGSCSKLPDVKLPGPCNFLNIPQLPIKNIFECLDKKMIDCTFQKGIYKGRRCVLDLSSFQMFALGNYYWKPTIAVIGKNKKYLCFEAMAHMA